jgi:hypothetical protein
MSKAEVKRRIIAAGGMKTIGHWWYKDGHWQKMRVNATGWREVEAVRSSGLVVGGSILDLDATAEVTHDYDGPHRFMVTWYHRNGEPYTRSEYTLNREEVTA